MREAAPDAWKGSGRFRYLGANWARQRPALSAKAAPRRGRAADCSSPSPLRVGPAGTPQQLTVSSMPRQIIALAGASQEPPHEHQAQAECKKAEVVSGLVVNTFAYVVEGENVMVYDALNEVE